MSRKYNSTWAAKKLIISFNQKQWRQDFASFVREKKYWDFTKVTRARAISNNPIDRGIKKFEVYNNYGGSVVVTFKEDNNIVNTTDKELVEQYFEERGM